ncbi:MAG: hypothetical protein AAF211_25790 [Myxococcota bacterium]
MPMISGLIPSSDRPKMPTSIDEARAIHQFTRLQILMEDWDDVIEEWLEEHIGAERATIWGIPDTSANSLADLCRQLATPGLYSHRPKVTHPRRRRGLIDEGGYLDQAGHWTKMVFVQYLTLGLGDMFVHLSVTNRGRFVERIVWPHNVHLVGDPEDHGTPVELWELHRRHLVPEDVWIYTWSVYDLGRVGPNGVEERPPSYRVYKAKPGAPSTDPSSAELGGKGEDLSARFIQRADGSFGALEGEAYPWRTQDGAPVFPYGRYQDSDTGQLWNTFGKRGVHRGALNNALYWTYTGRVARDATGSYAIVAGLTPTGTDVNLTSRRNEGSRDPVYGSPPTLSKIIEPGTVDYHELRDGETPFVHEFTASDNLPAILEFSERYEMRQAVRFGLNPSDLSRMAANPSSAAALMVSNEGKREFSRQVAPVFRRADLETIRNAAIVIRAGGLGEYPELGYSIRYHEIPRSPQEVADQRTDLEWKQAQGVMSRVDVYRELNPGTSVDDAVQALIDVAVQEQELEQAIRTATGAPEPPEPPDPTTDPDPDPTDPEPDPKPVPAVPQE